VTADLSARGRKTNLARMRSESFDLLVVGGGIVGAGIARDAAMRGLTTALLEREDFASGTSGKTSRLVHGGLRYLRNLKIGLVRQAVRERDVLLRQAPNLVRPLAFALPVYRGRGLRRTTIRLGLFVYDSLSRAKILPRRRWLSSEALRFIEPELTERGLLGGGLYYDAVANDGRLVLAVVRAAADAGAVIANHAEVAELLRPQGRVVGARVLDRISNESFDVRASVVVNATGVWLDRLRDRPAGPRTLRPTKGIHIFLPRARVGNRAAVALNTTRDDRTIFVLPWGALTLVGTTDTYYPGDPDRVVPEAEDVAYLLEGVNEAFPMARVGFGDVVSAYAGLRPLVGGRSSTKESDISREHEIFEDPDGLISIAGGKLTTHRAMAEDVVDRACRRLRRALACRTEATPLGSASDAEASFRALGFDEGTAAHLSARHSPEAIRPFLDSPRGRERILHALPHLWAEVDIAVEGEMALTLADVMVRRLGLFYESADQGLSVAVEVADRIAARLGWEPYRVERELREYGALVADHRRFLEGHGR